jgi:hypothetical protein
MANLLTPLLILVALQATLADHSKTPSVSNVPSTTTTQTPTSTAVPTGGQIADGMWDQEESWKFCDVSNADSADPAVVYQTWFAKFFYFIDKTFFVDQCIKWYHLEANCLSDSGNALLHVCFRGTGGPFGSALRDDVYTLQRMEFHNATWVSASWRGLARIRGTDAVSGYASGDAWCSTYEPAEDEWSGVDRPTNDDYEVTYADMSMASDLSHHGCWLAVPWLTMPHYNAYEMYSDSLLSVTLMVENVFTDFDVLVRAPVIKAPDTASVTPSTSASPTKFPSWTASNSPLGPFLTGWNQYMPRLDCDLADSPIADWPVRRSFDYLFNGHDGHETGDFWTMGNITGFPSKEACEMNWRASWTARILATGFTFLETAKEEGEPASYTLGSVQPARAIQFVSHRWRATEYWNNAETGCACEAGFVETTKSVVILDLIDFADCCVMFSAWTGHQFMTVHQHDLKHDDKWHRHAQISDLSANWYDIDTNSYMDYYPTDRDVHTADWDGESDDFFQYQMGAYLYDGVGKVMTRDRNDVDMDGDFSQTNVDDAEEDNDL